MSFRKANSLILGIALLATFLTASAMSENKQTLRESIQLTKKQIQLLKPEYLKQRHFLEPHAVKYLDKYFEVTNSEITNTTKSYKPLESMADDVSLTDSVINLNNTVTKINGIPVTKGEISETYDPIAGQTQLVFFVGEPHLGVGLDEKNNETLIITYNESKESRMSQATVDTPQVVSFPSFSGFAVKTENGFQNFTMPGYVPCFWNEVLGMSLCSGNNPLGDQVVMVDPKGVINILDIEAVGGSSPIDLRVYKLQNSVVTSFPYFKSGGLINPEREFFALTGISLSDKPWGIGKFVGTKTIHLGFFTEHGAIAVSDGIYIAPREDAFLNEIQLKSHYKRISTLKGSWMADNVSVWQNVHMAEGKNNTLIVVWIEIIGQQFERVRILTNTAQFDTSGNIQNIGEQKIIANPGPTGSWSNECTSRVIEVNKDPTRNARHLPGISLSSNSKTGTVNLAFSRRDAGNDLGGIYLMQSTDNGQTWSNQKKLTPEPGVQFNPDIAQDGERIAISYDQVVEENGIYKNYKMVKVSLDDGLTWRTYQLGDENFMDFISRDPLVRTCHYEEYGGIAFKNDELHLGVTQAFKEYKSYFNGETLHVPQIFYYKIAL